MRENSLSGAGCSRADHRSICARLLLCCRLCQGRRLDHSGTGGRDRCKHHLRPEISSEQPGKHKNSTKSRLGTFRHRLYGNFGGHVYNRNRLRSPYIFRSHPVLTDFKSHLDLESEGFGGNAGFGIVWEATEKVTFAFVYRTPTIMKTTGTAKGDIGQ